ncbi:hypothetical protein ADUPG1_005202, partial [Aduncisulcus paluster]
MEDNEPYTKDRAIGTQLPTSCLGYADDLIVFGDNAYDCNEKLAILADNLEAYAFVINPRKCFAIASDQLKIGDTLIHQGTASESMYLGIGIEPGAPLSAASLEQYKRAAQEARRIMSLPLLLPHLLVAVNSYIIPKFLYTGSLGFITQQQ